MNKECPVCLKPYTRTKWRPTKAGGYREFHHPDTTDCCGQVSRVRCCGAVGEHMTRMVVLAAGK